MAAKKTERANMSGRTSALQAQLNPSVFLFYFRFHSEMLYNKVLMITGASINSTHSLGLSLISDRRTFFVIFSHIRSFVIE